MTVFEDGGSAKFHIGIAVVSSVLALAMWSGWVDTDGLLSARLSPDAPRFIVGICAVGLLARVPWAIRVLVRPRLRLEVDGARITVDGRELRGDVSAHIPVGVLGYRGTQQYGPVDIFCDGHKVTRLESARPHRAVDLIERVNGSRGPT